MRPEGRLIVERQGQEGWGRAVMERLAVDIQREFPGVRGFCNRSRAYRRSSKGDKERFALLSAGRPGGLSLFVPHIFLAPHETR